MTTPRLGEHASKLLSVLTQTADRGEACPGSTAINFILSESGRDNCQTVINQLVDAGEIRIVRSRPSRVIEIVSTGKRTAETGADLDQRCSARHKTPKSEKTTLRTCLCCPRKFFSEGPGNRICKPCKDERFKGLGADMVGA